MTINLAWRDGEAVFLVADSALTYPFGGTPRRTTSAVGERQRAGRNRVEEAGAKIVPLAQTVVATYTGDSGTAVAALLAIRNTLESGIPIRDCLLAVIGQVQQAPRFQLIVASAIGGHNELWVVDPLHSTAPVREIYLDREAVVLGSLPKEAAHFIQASLFELYRLEPLATNPNRALASVIMALQAMGQRIDLFQHQAGGTFFGMRLGHGEVVCQDDLIYFLFKRQDLETDAKRRSDPLYLFSGIRHGLLIARSSLTADYKVFVTAVHKETNAGINKLMAGVVKEFEGVTPVAAHHYGFVDRETGALVQVYSPTKRPRRYLDLQPGTLVLKPGLIARLLSLPTSQNGILPELVPHEFLTDD